MKDEVILVNEKDEQTGVMDKMEAHRRGDLHRAFSVFIFDCKGRMLLQQRAAGKYHGAHLWTNACCSHPYPGENVGNAARRRIFEEMGFSATLEPVFSFLYRAEVENGLVEHEYDHVFAGEWDGAIIPEASEVQDFRFMEMEDIERELQEDPGKFTAWFHIAYPRIREWWNKRYRSK